MIRKQVLLFLLLAVVFISACTQQDYVLMNGSKVKVEIANSAQEKSIGLMHRPSLEQNAGMLFMFQDEEIRTFWMKNTLIPLDMIFISKGLKVVDVIEAEPCREDPCALYTGNERAQYVLEVNRGYAREHHISIGSPVKLGLKNV